MLDVGEDYGGAFGGAELGAPEADALGGAGYDDDFVLEAIRHRKKSEEFNTGKEKDNAETQRALRFGEMVDTGLE